jgi:uncharacterized protein
MSEANAAQEPTMEEILASIRRIISEDEAPAAQAAEPQAAPAPEPEPAAVAHEEPAPPPPPAAPPRAEEVLELTQRVEPEPPRPAPQAAPAAAPQSLGDLDFSDAHVAEPPPHTPTQESLVSDRAASAAASHFGALAQSLAMPAAGRTLEDVVKELIKPLLKEWLDAHLPKIVEASVAAEVERISRRSGR